MTASAQPQCLTNADTNCDMAVNVTELIAHINAWYACSACVPDIFQALQAYFGIPFCGDWGCNATAGEDCSTCQHDCGNCTIPGPCSTVVQCSDYTDPANCTINPCNISGSCQWDTGQAACKAIQSFPMDYVSHWKFEGNADDETGTNHGTLLGGASITSDAEKGQALSLDGLDDNVEIADDDSLSPAAFSISLWIKPRSGVFGGIAEGYAHFLGKANTGADKQAEYKFRIYNSSSTDGRPNRISFYVFNLAGGLGVGSYFQDAIDYGNEWIHVVGVYNGTHTFIYKNGIFRDSDDATSINYQNGNAPLRIGTGETEAGGWFNGTVDDVMVYDRTLSASEVQQIYNAQGPAAVIETCSDGIKNQDETDIDCGGTICSSCESGQSCLVDSDCSGNNCEGGACAAASTFPTDFISHWRFEGNADDEAGTNNGTLMNGASITSDAEKGQALSLDGMDDYVEAADSSSLDIMNEITLTAWVNLNSYTGNTKLVVKPYSLYGHPWELYGLAINQYPYFKLSDGTNDYAASDSPNALSLNAWHHIAATYDGNTLRIYVDNVLKNSNPAGSFTIDTNDQPLRIGARDPTREFIDGLVDDVMIYDRALNASEIQDIYNTQSPGAVAPICNDGTCDSGENCPADAGSCTDNTCYEPTCTNGCGQVAVAQRGNDESCSLPLFCDGSGSCVECIDNSDCAGAEQCISGTCQVSSGNVYYVDKDSIGGACSDSNSGTIDQPWCTIGKANSALIAGDTVYIRGGTYYETINPARSGTSGNEIAYRDYPGEEAIIDMQDYTIGQRTRTTVDLQGRSYINIDGLTLTNAKYLVRIDNAQHCIIQNSKLQFTDGAVISWGPTSYNKILNNYIEVQTQAEMNAGYEYYSIWFGEEGDGYNLIEGNEILMAGAYGIVTENEYNIIRSNNIHHCGDKGISLFMQTAHDVVENNVFHHIGVGPDGQGFNVNFFSGSHTILRNNVIYDDWDGPGNFGESALLGLWSRDDLGSCYQNRIYNNVIYGGDNFGVSLGHSGSGIHSTTDNVFKNNIIYKNIVQKSVHFYSYPEHPMLPPYQDIVFDDNLISTGTNGQDVIYFFQQGQAFTLAEAESSHPAVFMNNIEGDPLFVDETGRDFHLQSGSPMIDAGAFLTTTTSAVSGTQITVQDAKYFFDGFGIFEGDLIQLEGQTQTARITSIDYNTNTITVDTSLSWNAGQGVSLAYEGSAPDIGAYEYGG